MSGVPYVGPGQTVARSAVAPDALAAALPTFSAQPDPFLIVEDGPDRFVQLCADGADTFVVEYGAEGEVYQHPGGDRTLDQAVALVEAFARGVWPPFEDGVPLGMREAAAASPGHPAGYVLALLALAALAALFLLA